jgi:hypothetical protein
VIKKEKEAISPCFFFPNLILKNIDEKQARNLSDFTFEWYKQHALQDKVVKPFLFSFRKVSVGSQKAFIQIENSHLSEGLNIDSLQVTKHYQAYFLKFLIFYFPIRKEKSKLKEKKNVNEFFRLQCKLKLQNLKNFDEHESSHSLHVSS